MANERTDKSFKINVFKLKKKLIALYLFWRNKKKKTLIDINQHPSEVEF